MAREKRGVEDTVRDWATVGIAIIALGVSIRACNQSDKSYDLAVRNASPEFLLETDPLGKDLRPGPLKISARVKNVGTTTAFRVVSVGRIDPFKWVPMNKSWFKILPSANHDIEPQQSAPVFFGPDFDLTPDDIADLKSGKAELTYEVWVTSDAATPGSERPAVTFRRAYDRATGEWVRGFPGGNPKFETR